MVGLSCNLWYSNGGKALLSCKVRDKLICSRFYSQKETRVDGSVSVMLVRSRPWAALSIWSWPAIRGLLVAHSV